MAEFEAIGKALQIPQSVLNNIDKIDQKINLIASDSEKMATHFMSAMTRMGGGAEGLLTKLNAIQNVIGKLDLSKFAQSVTTVGQGTTQVEQFAAAIAKAAEAINKYNAENRKRTDVDNSKQIAQLNKEIEAMRKRTQQLEEYINKQRQANQGGGRRGGGSSSSGTNSDTKALNAYNRAMAASEALVTQRINKIAKLRQAEEMLRSASGNYATQLNRISQEIARLNRLNEGQVDSYGRVIRSQRNLVNTSQQLTRQLALLFSVSQIEGYISKLVQVRGEFELQQVALTSILQNKDQADQLFAQITELAVRSPFTIKELTTYTKSLAAYQVQYEDLYDTTKMLADVSAGLGVDMQRLILAFGQVKAANFLRGTETRQFTEAGINMLGELSKYYTELEGRIVSVQEVQDRQFKRMISFKDVEEVFKRLTSAGGMFYNMQERQAETLAGQMSNLRDQFDLMFNEIGKDNQGAINTSISAIKLLIENWEIFANMLKAAAVGLATYTTTTLIAAAANGKFAASAVAATTSTKGLVGITAKLITSMKAFGTFLKTNPITIIATALASAIYFWNDHRKAVEDNRKAYDPLVNSVNRTITAVDELTKKIGEQNDRIKTANDNVGQYEKGTSEYARAEANANDEREKQNKLLEELETKYPEIYNGIIRQKDGTVDYTNALKEFNGQLEQQNYLNYLARQTATSDDNGFLNNASKAAEAQQNLKIATEDANNAFILMQGRIREYFATNKYASDDLRKQLEEVGNSSLSSADKIYRMFTIITSAHGINIGDLRDIAWDFVDVAREATKAEKELQSANEELSEDINQISTDYKNAYDTTSEEGKRTAQSLLEQFLRNVGIQNQAVLDFVKQQFEVTIGVKLDLSNQVKPELSEVGKKINEYIGKNKLNLVGEITPDDSIQKYFDKLNSKFEELRKEYDKLKKATQERVEGKSNKQRISELKEEMRQVKMVLDAYGEWNDKNSKYINKQESAEIKRLKEQIKLIQDAGKEYEKYRKQYAEPMAQQLTKEAFTQPFEDVGLSVNMEFDVNGVIAGIRKVISTAGVEGQKIGNEAIAKLMTDTNAEHRTKEVEEYRKQIDELFASLSNYQELEKLGLNKDLISQLFGIDVSSINDVQTAFDKMKNILKGYGDEGEKVIADAEKKITGAQQKELKERLTQYAQMLRNSISERARIELEAQKEIAKVQATSELTPQQKEQVTKNIREEASKKKQEHTWKEFQDTDLYIRMFEDLESASTKSLDLMEQKLLEYRDSLKKLDPSDLKEITNLLEKMREIKIDRNPFKGFVSNLKEVIKYQNQADELNKKYAESLSKQEYLSGLVESQELSIDAAQKRYNEQVKLNGAGSQEAIKAKSVLDSQQEELESTRKLLENQKEITNEYGKQISLGDKKTAQANEQINKIGSYGSQAVNSLTELTDMLSNFGIDFGETFSGVVSGLGQAFQGLEQIDITKPMSIITGAVSVVSGIGNAIASIFGGGDNKKEKEIQRQLELVEDLQKAYEKLEKAIDDAYSIDTYKEANDQAIANLESQNASLQAAIAAEQDKKKTDDDRIKEWRQQIEDNNEAIEELLKEQFSQVTGGILDDILSAANDFTDAWLESFKEVGDGMDGLEENFQEMLTNMLKQQASMLITGTYLDRWKRELEKYINADDLELTAGEAKNWVDAVTSSLPGLNQALEEYFKAMQQAGFDLSGEGEGDTLTGLSKSISGITEQQADALSALCESIRFFTSDSNAVLHSIYNFLLVPHAESPLMQELRVQTTHLSSIDSLLGSVIKNSSSKGKIMRVEIV